MRSLALLVPALLLAGCPTDPGDTSIKPGTDTDDETGSTPDDSGDDSGDDTSETGISDVVDGTVNGTITLQLYSYDDLGDLEYLDWVETYGYYPFGNVFLAAYELNEITGNYTYYDTLVLTPSTEGLVGAYSFPLHAEGVSSVHIYAALDWYADGIIATYEPIGTYNSGISLHDGEVLDDADITIMVPWYDIWATGGGCSTTSIGGDVHINGDYESGTAAALVYTESMEGPVYGSYLAPAATDEGAEAAYAVSVCAGETTGVLLGCWDSNGNGMVDPADTWGTYVVDGDDGNPITYGGESLSGYDVEIPFGEVGAPAIIPDVSITGLITVLGDLATSPPAEAVTYVVVSRKRPPADFDVTDPDNWWDRSTFDATKMAEGSFDYRLTVPANSSAYLWAFIDLDGDGLVNEVGEPVGAAFNTSGSFLTGRTAWTDVDFFLADADTPPE